MPTWTKPYCGIQHLDDVMRSWQASVEEHPGWSGAYVLHRTRTVSVSRHPAIEKARAWAEAEARRLLILRPRAKRS